MIVARRGVLSRGVFTPTRNAIRLSPPVELEARKTPWRSKSVAFHPPPSRGRESGGGASVTYELGPASKPALSTSSEARLRNLAMLSSGSVSALSGPQLCTISDGFTLVLTGYSLLAVA